MYGLKVAQFCIRESANYVNDTDKNISRSFSPEGWPTNVENYMDEISMDLYFST